MRSCVPVSYIVGAYAPPFLLDCGVEQSTLGHRNKQTTSTWWCLGNANVCKGRGNHEKPQGLATTVFNKLQNIGATKQ